MLTELALMPQVFDDDANTDDSRWLEHIRGLGRCMFRPGTAAATVVSDLYDGSCLPVLKSIVDSIRDHSVRTYAQGLLPKILDAGVWRPQHPSSDWPEDEEGWVKEAVAAHLQESLQRIIVTSHTYRQAHPECRAICSLAEFDEEKEATPSYRMVPMNISQQVEILRPLWLHAGFLAIGSSSIHCKGTDDADFVTELAHSMFSRPWRAEGLVLDIHTMAAGRADSENVQNQLFNIRRRFGPLAGRSGQIRVFLWPKILDRWLLAGSKAVSQTRPLSLKARWGITLNHVARRDDSPDMAPTTWTLLTAADTTQLYKRYYGQPKGLVHGPEVLS
jgi:hypothetical protein